MFRISSVNLMMLGVDIHGGNSDNRWLRAGKFASTLILILGVPTLALGLLHAFLEEHEMPQRIMAIAFMSRKIITIMRINRLKKNLAKINDDIRSTFTDIEYPSMLHKNVEDLRASCLQMPADHLLLAVFTLAFMMFIVIMALAARVHAFLTGVDAPLLFPMYLPESVTSNSLLMLYFHLSQVAIAFMTRVGLVGAQLHFMVLVRLATKNLAHLNAVLRTLQTSRVATDDQISVSRTRTILKYIIKQHQRSISFVDGLNDSFSGSILIEVWGVTLISFTAIFYVMKMFQKLSTVRIVLTIMNLSTSSIYFAIICWYAQKLINESMAISSNCVSTTWWNWLPQGLDLDVSIICTRAKEPLCIKAGPFYLLSLKTLIAIMELSITYFLVLFQLYV